MTRTVTSRSGKYSSQPTVPDELATRAIESMPVFRDRLAWFSERTFNRDEDGWLRYLVSVQSSMRDLVRVGRLNGEAPPVDSGQAGDEFIEVAAERRVRRTFRCSGEKRDAVRNQRPHLAPDGLEPDQIRLGYLKLAESYLKVHWCESCRGMGALR